MALDDRSQTMLVNSLPGGNERNAYMQEPLTTPTSSAYERGVGGQTPQALPPRTTNQDAQEQIPLALPATTKQSSGATTTTTTTTTTWPPLATAVTVIPSGGTTADAGSRSPFPVPRGDQGYYNHMPRRVICQYCGYQVITSINRRPGFGAHVFALGMCLFGLWPCCVIPYVVDDCQDATHFCPNCGQVLGERRFL